MGQPIGEITTKILDHFVHYDESDDLWKCRQLSLSASSLSAMRRKIRLVVNEQRRVDKVPVLVLEGYRIAFTEATLTLIDGDEGWIGQPGHKQRAPTRSRVSLSDLMLDTPANREVILQLQAETISLNNSLAAVMQNYRSLPRLTPEKVLPSLRKPVEEDGQ